MSISLNKIACSLNNSAAISENGEIYVWGSGRYGLTCTPDTESRVSPCSIDLQRKNQFYEAIHISCGLSHMAAIVKNSIIDKIDSKREPSDMYRRILEKQKHMISSLEINILEKFEINKNPDGFVPMSVFKKFINNELGGCDYTPEEKKSLPEFIYYFCLDIPDKANILQYYYFINNNENYFSAFIWGTPNNGRLGLSEEQVNKNEIINKKNDLKSIKKEQESENRILEVTGKTIEDELIGNDPFTIGKNKIRRIMPTKIDFKQNNVNIIKIACGHHHTMALDENGILYTWGMGSQGCLGNGKLGDIYEPTPINNSQHKATYAFESGQDTKFKDIACGSYHSMALAISEVIFTWGANSRGQLGHGNTNTLMKPRKISHLEQEKVGILLIEAGDQHSAAISSSNELYTWGCGAYYRLGHGLAFDELTPKKVEVLEDVYVTHVSCGASHTLCITNEGFIYGWGNGMCGKLGIEEKCTKNYILPTRVGTYLGKFRRKQFQEVCAGPLHSMALTADGIIYSWGSSKNGILGLDRRNEDVYLPSKIPRIRFSHLNFGKREESNIQFHNIYYLRQFYEPEKILYKEEEVVCAMACAVKNTFFLTQDGKLYCVGSNIFGLLVKNPLKQAKMLNEGQTNANKQGLNIGSSPDKVDDNSIFNSALLNVKSVDSKSPKNYADKNKKATEKDFYPVPIHYFKKKIVYISCSYNHALAINELGRVFSWGANLDYQLGLGFPSKYEFIPQKLSGALETKIVKMTACSEKFSALLTDVGEVWTFGTSEQGSLGHEEKNSYIIPIPKMINDIPPMAFIACGPEHMMSISAFKGELYAWGSNIYGQLGLGNTAKSNNENLNENLMNKSLTLEKGNNEMKVFKPKLVPLIIGDFTLKVEMVALGMYHTVLLSTEKYLFSCGLKKYAGLPLVDLSQNFEYVDTFNMIPSLRNKKFQMVACGEFHTLAVSELYEVFGWGSSLFGRLGEIFWRGGEEDMLEGYHLIRKNNVAEDIKLLMPPGTIFENAENKSNKQMKFVSCGPTHSGSINKHGQAYTWGSGVSGKLGVFLEEYFKSDGDEIAQKNKKNNSTFVIPKRKKVVFKPKLNKTSFLEDKDSNNPETRFRGTSTHSKHSQIKNNLSTNRISSIPNNNKNEKKTENSELNINEDSEKEKGNASDLLIRENSSIESEDLLETMENNQIQAPRESTFGPNLTPNERRSMLKNLDKTVDLQLNNITNISDINKKTNVQDQLQRELFMEKADLKEEKLMAEDNDLEKNLLILVERKLKIAMGLTKEYNILLNRIDSVIYARMNILNQKTKNSKGIPFLKNIQHKVPTFVLQNIQLYETVFSFLRLHPCYIMKIISTHLLNNSQVNQLINVLYNNPISTQSSICSLISLSQMVFDFEVRHYFKITEIKNFKIGSIFWQIYLIMFLNQESNRNFIVSFAKNVIVKSFCQYYYDNENLSAKYNDAERNKIMQKALEFQEDDQQQLNFEGETKASLLINHLISIITALVDKFIDNINEAHKTNKFFISKQMAYLHHSMIDIYKNIEIQKAQDAFQNTNEFEIVREEDKKRFAFSLNPLTQKAIMNSEIFIKNLYFGILIHVIQNYEQYDIVIPKEFLPFIEKSNNLKILCELIEKYFAKEPYADEKKFKSLNEVILNQNENYNKLIYRKLTEYDYFNLTLNHLVETLTNYFDYKMIIYEVSLEFLFILHNLYCKSIKTIPHETFLLRKKEEDPIYIIFKYLDLEEIPINDYNSDTLRMNINLRIDPKFLLYSQVSDNSKSNEKFQFYRCLNCNILLPKNLLCQEHSDRIMKLEKFGWHCDCEETQMNNIRNFRCQSPKCNKVIPIEDFNYLSIINKYYQEADHLQYLFLDILKHMDLMKADKDIMKEIQENLERGKKKENHYLVGKITDFLNDLENKVNESEEIKTYHKKKEKVYTLILQKLRENGLMLMRKRQDHRKYQIYLKDTLNSLDLSTREKFLSFKAALKDLLKTEQLVLPKQSDKKQLYFDENEDEEDIKIDHQQNLEYLKNKQFNIFGVFTSSELFSNKTLRSCKFTNMDIPKILKHLKFYINSTDEGGFLIRVVYLNEHWLNIFIRCIKSYFFNEVTLQTVEISLEKYIELKRTANFKSICTFGSEKVSATFNVFYLLKILRDIESQVLIQYNVQTTLK